MRDRVLISGVMSEKCCNLWIEWRFVVKKITESREQLTNVLFVSFRIWLFEKKKTSVMLGRVRKWMSFRRLWLKSTVLKAFKSYNSMSRNWLWLKSSDSKSKRWPKIDESVNPLTLLSAIERLTKWGQHLRERESKCWIRFECRSRVLRVESGVEKGSGGGQMSSNWFDWSFSLESWESGQRVDREALESVVKQ